MTVTKERAVQMFNQDLEILMDNLCGMRDHYNIADWEAFVFLRKPDCPQSYIVKCASADDSFARQIIQLHQLADEPTAGADGRYCTHHDDDPAHGKECYNALRLTGDQDRSLGEEFAKKCKRIFPMEISLEQLASLAAVFAADIRRAADRGESK